VLACPESPSFERSRAEEDAGKEPYAGKGEDEPIVWFKQTIGNACGTYGLLHAICNNEAFIVKNSPLDKLLTKIRPLDPKQRARALEESEELESFHARVAAGGQTAAPPAEDEAEAHYVCFTKSAKNGHLYELDGGRLGPLDRGQLADDEDVLGENAIKEIKRFIDREQGSGSVKFSLLAMGPADD